MKKMSKFEVKLGDFLAEKSFESEAGWALVPLMWADQAVYQATESRRRWKRACIVLGGLLTLALGVLACAILL